MVLCLQHASAYDNKNKSIHTHIESSANRIFYTIAKKDDKWRMQQPAPSTSQDESSWPPASLGAWRRKNSSKARHTYKLDFDRRVRHTRQLNADDTVYVDIPPTSKCRQALTSARDDQLVMLQPKKSGPYEVVLAAPYKVTADIDGLHNNLAVIQVTLSQAEQEVSQDTSERNYDNQSSQKYGSMLVKPHPEEILEGEEAETGLENYGRLPTAPEDARQA